MDSALKLILLVEELFVLNLGLSTNQKGICSKTVLGEPKCCANYRKIGMTCEECWPGTYGENCKKDCPSGRYGRFCIEVCLCEACNKVTGCSINTSSDIEDFQVLSTTDFKENIGAVSDRSSQMSTIRFTGVKRLECVGGISSTYVHRRNISDETFWTATRGGNIKEQSYDMTTRIVSNIKDNVSVTNANQKPVKGNGLEWWIIFVAFGFILLGIAFGCICSKKCSKVHQPAVYFQSEIVNDRNKNFEQEAYSVLRKDRNKEQSINEQKSSTSSSLQVYVEIDDCIEEFSPSIDSH